MLGDRYRHHVLRDLEPAIRHIERHVKVLRLRRNSRELRVRQTHRIGPDIRSLRAGSTLEGNVAFQIQWSTDVGNRISADGVLFAVIGLLIVVASNVHGHGQRSDLQLPVRHIERHVEVRVIVRELALRQAHLVGPDVRSLRGRVSVERKVILGVQRIADLHLIVFDLLLGAVVDLRVGVSGDRHGHSQRGDLQLPVHDHELHGEVRVVVPEHRRGQAHVISPDVRSPRGLIRGGADEREISLSVQIVAD